MLSKFQNESENEVEEKKQYVVFTVNNQEFGVDITQAKEIINKKELTSIPNAPDFVEGVTNLRGEIVPIINLNKRLKIDREKKDNLENKTIIVEFQNTLVGMDVEDVKGIITMNSANISDAPEITQGINQEYISGVGKLENSDKLLILLNLNKVLSKDEVKQLEEIEVNE